MVSYTASFLAAVAVVAAFNLVSSQRTLPLVPVSPIQQNILVEPPKPYSFGFESADGLGTKQHRQETADALGVVRGTYGYVDPLGMYRNVEYTAGADGYRAIVHSNEPGMASKNTAGASYVIELPPPAVVAQGLAYLPQQGLKL